MSTFLLPAPATYVRMVNTQRKIYSQTIYSRSKWLSQALYFGFGKLKPYLVYSFAIYPNLHDSLATCKLEHMNITAVESAKAIINQIAFGTLATVSSEQLPWNSPVLMVHDPNLNFYWFSDRQSQHAKNVRDNGNVFVVIYDSTVSVDMGALDRGFYFKGKANELSDPHEIAAACMYRKGHDHKPENFMGEAVRRVYRAIPEQAWVNTIEIQNGKFVRDYRVDINLDELRRLIKT